MRLWKRFLGIRVKACLERRQQEQERRHLPRRSLLLQRFSSDRRLPSSPESA